MSLIVLRFSSQCMFFRYMVSMMSAKGSMATLMRGDIAQMFLTILLYQLLLMAEYVIPSLTWQWPCERICLLYSVS